MVSSSVAGGIVVNNDGGILVVNNLGFFWSFPKGHVDIGEDLLMAAKREIYEESGVNSLEYIDKLGSFQRMGGKNNDEFKDITLFLFHTNQHDLKPVDPDNPEARWVPKEEVVNLLTHKKDKEFWLGVKDNVV